MNGSATAIERATARAGRPVAAERSDEAHHSLSPEPLSNVQSVLYGARTTALRAAEVLFHRAAGGKSAIRPVGPAAFNAEIDADWLELVARAKQVRPISHAEAESIVREALARQMGGVA